MAELLVIFSSREIILPPPNPFPLYRSMTWVTVDNITDRLQESDPALATSLLFNHLGKNYIFNGIYAIMPPARGFGLNKRIMRGLFCRPTSLPPVKAIDNFFFALG